MARRRHSRPAFDVRIYLLVRYRRNASRYQRALTDGPVVAPSGGVYREPYSRVVEALDRGDEVAIYSWELPREARSGFGINDRLIVAADGALRLEDRENP